MVVECASCRPSCWLLGRARSSSVEGGRGGGRGLNPLSSGTGGSGGGGTTVKGGGTGECAEAVTATIPCRSPRAIDRSRDKFTTKTEAQYRSEAAGPVRVQRESTSERETGQHLGRGVRHARHSPARPPCPRDHPPRRARRHLAAPFAASAHSLSTLPVNLSREFETAGRRFDPPAFRVSLGFPPRGKIGQQIQERTKSITSSGKMENASSRIRSRNEALRQSPSRFLAVAVEPLFTV
jgi:hypothetical protein